MTSVRRAARHPKVAASVAGVAVPPELLDGDAAVWHHQRAYHAFMSEHDWPLPCSERFGIATHPANRRMAAATAWAEDNGTPSGGDADLHKLRDLGLIEG